jgi:hypothetical protein
VSAVNVNTASAARANAPLSPCTSLDCSFICPTFRRGAASAPILVSRALRRPHERTVHERRMLETGVVMGCRGVSRMTPGRHERHPPRHLIPSAARDLASRGSIAAEKVPRCARDEVGWGDTVRAAALRFVTAAGHWYHHDSRPARARGMLRVTRGQTMR